MQYYVVAGAELLGSLPIADHKYDYEAIFIYIRPREAHPVGVGSEYTTRDEAE